VPRRLAGRVRGAAPGQAPVLRRHPGPPGAALQTDASAPAVRGAHRRGAEVLRGKGRALMGGHGGIADTPDSWPVERSETRYRSHIVGMVTDWVRMPG